jgi:hypothetical protein
VTQPARRQDLTVVEHLRSLELGVDATGDDVRTAFRRLARQHHPDLDRTGASTKRFIEVVAAYRALQIEMGLSPNMAHYRLCPRCGHYGELLDGLDGRPGCADCLLGLTVRRHFLPLLTFATVKHVGTIALYAISILCAILYAQHGRFQLAALSVGCAVLGLLLLFVTCLTVPDVVPAARRCSRLTDGLFILCLISVLVLGLVLTLVGLVQLPSSAAH